MHSISSSKLKVSLISKSFLNIKKRKEEEKKKSWHFFYDFVTVNAFSLIFNVIKLYEETKRTI